ncbi:MAG: hypothetical protein ACRD4C_10830 [Candidatus Acidiferrales bacterium]
MTHAKYNVYVGSPDRGLAITGSWVLCPTHGMVKIGVGDAKKIHLRWGRLRSAQEPQPARNHYRNYPFCCADAKDKDRNDEQRQNSSIEDVADDG